MTSERRFSDYHLFKLLKQTPVASTYRAGRIQARAVDRVVLLYVFDRQPSARDRFWSQVRDRGGVQDLLTDPPFARGVELGIFEGTPFAAYDYLVGRSLDDVLARSRELRMPLSLDQTLAIVDQAATALVEAQKKRFDGSILLHGALTPALIHLSQRGEVKTLGFETAPGLRVLDSDSSYCSPELRGGEPTTSSDDVFSMAAILFETLTGLPPSPTGSYAAQVDQASLAGDTAPLPAPLQELLKQGLARRDRRAPDVLRWRHTLRKVIADGMGRASEFQLSFFLHALFRRELEEEGCEAQDERAGRWTVATGVEDDENVGEEVLDDTESEPATEEPAEISLSEDALSEEPPAESSSTPAPATPEDRQGSVHFLVGLAASLMIAAIATVAFLSSGARGSASEPRAAETSEQARALIVSRAAALEDDLKAEYGPRLAELRERLVVASRREARPSQPSIPVASTTEAVPVASSSGGPATISAGTPPETQPSAIEPPTEVDASTEDLENPPLPQADATEPGFDTGVETHGDSLEIADSEPARDEEAGELPVATADPPGVELSTVSAESGGAPPEPGGRSPMSPMSPTSATLEMSGMPEMPETPEPVEANRREPLAEPTVGSTSSLANPAEDEDRVVAAATPPRLVDQPPPRYPRVAQRLGRAATVRLRVLVDETGRPVETELLSPPAGLGFEKAAVRTAMASRWTPATRDGAPVSDWAVLSIEFKP